jgi:localization factor PodJL
VRQVFDQAVAKQQAGDLAGAAALMRAAADTGDARSIQRLAKMYERGEGVPRDPGQARALTERAAQRGNSQAMHNLGVYYAEGEGPSRDLGKAAENFRRAASRGVTDSQFNLGAMAEQGMGGPRSEREAYYWYSVAGRSGDRDAASKARELAARLPAAERAAEDQRVAQFRAEASPGD